ncbi:MAG: hypothetical protein KatS3mg105_2949 [Gemmatales bacterium]|nr:MAG: hypothetical protein KatS3mg105_2949 [Gemmatales bacterium]
MEASSRSGQSNRFPPFELNGLKTYDLKSRPSKVFQEDLGQPVGPDAKVSEWIDSLPRQLAGMDLRRVRDHVCRAVQDQRLIAAGIGGHVIKTGCAPYLIDWIERGVLSCIAMNGSAAIHDYELAVGGKTSEDVAVQLPAGKFGMVRETADAFALASRVGSENELGLGWALGKHLAETDCPYKDKSILLAAYRAGIPCTIHVSIGCDIVHMHPHVSGAALGEASMIDFRRLCSVVAALEHGMWFNIGSAVVLPEVFVKAVSVVRNFGYSLDGLTTVNIDKNANYRSRVNVLDRPSSNGIELIGHHEIVIPLLHAAVNCKLASGKREKSAKAA